MKFARWRDFNSLRRRGLAGGRGRRGAGLKSPQRFIFHFLLYCSMCVGMYIFRTFGRASYCVNHFVFVFVFSVVVAVIVLQFYLCVANVVGYIFRLHFRSVSTVVGVECMDFCRLNVLAERILAC